MVIATVIMSLLGWHGQYHCRMTWNDVTGCDWPIALTRCFSSYGFHCNKVCIVGNELTLIQGTDLKWTRVGQKIINKTTIRMFWRPGETNGSVTRRDGVKWIWKCKERKHEFLSRNWAWKVTSEICMKLKCKSLQGSVVFYGQAQ